MKRCWTITLPNNAVTIRQLTPTDAIELQRIRLHALACERMAFSASLAEEQIKTLAAYEADIHKDYYCGAFAEGRLIGIAGYTIIPFAKQAHRGILHGVYLMEEHRGKGIAASLIRHALSHAKQRLEIMTLGVCVVSKAARAAYIKEGFQSYGIEPKMQKIDGVYYDEEYMWLDLTSYNPGL